MKQTKIICIVGPSGCGKTTLAKFIEKELGIKTLVSYTTRPKRPEEIEGVDHYFVTEQQMPYRSEMLAYTKFSGYHYWTALQDVRQHDIVLYVIDEKGLIMLLEEYSDMFSISSILIKRDKDKLIQTVGEERVKRDKCRVRIDENNYDAVISNNSDLLSFFEEAVWTIKLLMK